MKDENTNLDLNQNVNPQPENLNPVGGVTQTPVTPEVAPVEMPAPAAVESQPVEMPAPAAAPTTPVEMPAPAPAEQTIASPDLGSAQMSNLAPVAETVTPAEVAPVADATSPEAIAQGIENGTMVNAVSDPNEMIGAKVGNAADDTDAINKKKSKKNITIIIVILVILAILGVAGYFLYNYEYKSANKRIDAMFNKLNSYVIPLITDVEKRMGDYEVTANLKAGTDADIQLHASGNYAYNLEDYIYLDTKIDKIYVNQDMLDKTPIEAKVYLNDEKVYLKVEELYEKYIYTDFPTLKEVMENIKQNDIDYPAVYTAFINAFKTSIETYATSQTVSKATINGKSQQANVVTIKINKSNYKTIMTAMSNKLANNKIFISNLAKLSGESEDDITKGLKSVSEMDDDFDGNLTVNIYSPLFGNSVLGVDIIAVDGDNNYKVSIVPVGNNKYKVTGMENDRKEIEFTYGFGLTQSSGKKSYVTSFEGEFESGSSVIQINTEFKYNINVPYQEDKPVTRDAVKYESLTTEDMMKIYDNLTTKYGMIGTYIEEELGSLFGGSSSSTDLDYSEYANYLE